MIHLANSLSKKIFSTQKSFEEYIRAAEEKCAKFQNCISTIQEEDHHYSMETAKEELGLEDELIETLLSDFVTQIITTLPQFRQIVKKMQNDFKKGLRVDFDAFRNLVHKNLGVARNLRIKNVQKILYSLMKEEDLGKIKRCMEYLEGCVILLKPEVAYKAYKST